jgi:hypothetical protein
VDFSVTKVFHTTLQQSNHASTFQQIIHQYWPH